MITSSGVPGRAWLRTKEYIIPKSRTERMAEHKELLDRLNEDGVESDVEDAGETGSGEEGA